MAAAFENTSASFQCEVHGDAIKGGRLISRLYGESAIITMYSKCGKLDYAHQAFKSIDNPCEKSNTWSGYYCVACLDERFGEIIENGEELPSLLGINTRHGKHKYSDKGLAGVFESHLKELNAPFHEAPDKAGWFLTTKVATQSWLESRKEGFLISMHRHL